MTDYQRYKLILQAARKAQARGLRITNHDWGLSDTGATFQPYRSQVCPMGALCLDQISEPGRYNTAMRLLNTSIDWISGCIHAVDQAQSSAHYYSEGGRAEDYRHGYTVGQRILLQLFPSVAAQVSE